MFSETQRHMQANYPDRADRTVTLRREVYETLAAHADAWRDMRDNLASGDELLAFLVESPSVRELLMQEYAAWSERRGAAESSHAISREGSWTGRPSHAELEARRAQPGTFYEDYVAAHGEYTGGPVEWDTGQPVETQRRPAA